MKKLILLFIFILFLGGIFAFCDEGQIDINSASAVKLEDLDGIGPVYAKRIIELRPFESIDDLTRVSGIAEKRLEKIKIQGLACVGEEAEETSQENITEQETEKQEIAKEVEHIQNNPIQSHVIELTKSIKSENNTEEKDKSVYAKYGFAILCVLLGILFILKKHKHKKNEFGR